MLVPLWACAVVGIVTFPAILLLCASKRAKVAPNMENDGRRGGKETTTVRGREGEQTPLLRVNTNNDNSNDGDAKKSTPGQVDHKDSAGFDFEHEPVGGSPNLLDGLITPVQQGPPMSFSLPNQHSKPGQEKTDFSFDQDDLSSHVLTRMPGKGSKIRSKRSQSEKRKPTKGPGNAIRRASSEDTTQSSQVGTLFSPASASDFHSSIVFEDTFLLENVPSDNSRLSSNISNNVNSGSFDSEHSAAGDGDRDSKPRRATSGPAHILGQRRLSAPVVSKVDSLKTYKSKKLAKDLTFGAYSNRDHGTLAEADDQGGEYDTDAWCETTSFSR